MSSWSNLSDSSLSVVNPKKSLRIRNNTKYFQPETDRTFFELSSPNSYRYRKDKIEGYENRLYWQFRDCQEHNGQTFYYTLTYNDKSCPNYLGRNCFDYNDLRDLLTGGFRKQLLRKYGCTFKYFIGAELGDGKGERGFHNNPHYHILFFLFDAHNNSFAYRLISPKDFRHLVRLYWQGFDQSYGFHSFQDAKYGIACEGENLGLVTDFRACMYCAKYCCKDVGLKSFEIVVESHLRSSSSLSGDELENYVREGLNQFRNRYCNKCRISHGVGDYALQFMDKLNPSVSVPDKKGFKTRSIGLYYYRKLFTDVYKDSIGSNIRVINSDGIKYKLSKLSGSIKRIVDNVSSQMSVVDRCLFDSILSSDLNTSVHLSYDSYLRLMSKFDLSKLFLRYAEYKLVYKDRFFSFHRSQYCIADCYPDIDIYRDYEWFLQPSFFSVDRSDSRLSDFLNHPSENWLSYGSHPYFLPYVCLFSLFDLCSDYFFVKKDDKLQAEAEERAAIKRYHDKIKLMSKFDRCNVLNI